MKKSKQPEPIFTSAELNSIINRIMVSISEVVAEEITKKKKALTEAEKIAEKILSMHPHDAMRLDDVAKLLGVPEKELITKISRMGIPYMDIFGNIRRGSFIHSKPSNQFAINRDGITLTAGSFDSEKGQALREYTAQAIVGTMAEFSKV